ncbi:hypothetical protein SD71_15425 [Cohnella kolymensis]|uniref:DUF6199 domain-containing protein n=1 Tax=Cohnella kolymensis TaxID=1590652 RepID=A0ABR5A1V1_9BACL|nr:DUF6199 family natural product biosynthesis protein [Cohnella kolymensis]KIL35051.1 hypothetical protein SD71_15425 [Cohnella kolymensis]
MWFLLSIFLLAVGLFMFFKPLLIWMITESWKSNDATEPSDLYIWSTRIGGVLFTLVGIGGIFVFTIL